ncbi:MAG: HAD family hydrolase, partial [Exiguobacterium acetylicum]
MANQKVVFFDIDGTLLHDGHFVPESTKQAIRKLQE